MPMKNSQSTIIIIVFTLLLIGGGFYFYLNQDKTKYSWMPTYDRQKDQPFDVNFTYQLLKNQAGPKYFHEVKGNIYNYFQKNVGSKLSNYVFVGQYYDADDSVSQLLIDYISKGNNVYIASNNKPDGLLDKILCELPIKEQTLVQTNENGEVYNDQSYEQEPDYYKPNKYNILDYKVEKNDSVLLKFKYQPLNIGRGYYFRYFSLYNYENYNWNYIDTADLFYYQNCADSSYIPLEVIGTINNNKPGFVRLSIGKGYLYIHSNPVVFTNYFMVEKKGFNYASNVFSYIQPGDIHWETESNRTLTPKARQNMDNQSPLKFILAQQAFRWAWYTLLVLVLLFVLFWSKRKQRFIPILPRKDNDSLEYYSTISRLYFLNQNHHNLSRLMHRHFGLFVRKKYLINIHDNQLKATELLANKTQLGTSFILSIFDHFNALENRNEITENELIDLYTKLQKFYLSTK